MEKVNQTTLFVQDTPKDYRYYTETKKEKNTLSQCFPLVPINLGNSRRKYILAPFMTDFFVCSVVSKK